MTPPVGETDHPDSCSPLPAVLFVDDDANILDAFRRQFRRKLDVHTALGPLDGLDVVTKGGTFAVIVSDFQMPGMNGIEFLTRVRSLAPDSVRIMLTGQADLSTAMGAVNQGSIFRFLVKPCLPFIFDKVLEASLEQHRLIIAERQLTEETLLGCVQVLTEVLSLVQPQAFSRSNRVRRYLKQIASGMGVRVTWQMEAAAMLSQIGWIALSPDLLARVASGEPLSSEELASFGKQASAAARMLEKIPRLDRVARIIERHQLSFRDLADQPGLDESDPTGTAPLLLKAAIEFDSLRHGGLGHEDVIRKLRMTAGPHSPQLIVAMAAIEKTEAQDEIRLVPLHALKPGMILEDELRSQNGVLVLGKGHEVPASFLHRLDNYTYGLSPERKCKVRIRKPSPEPPPAA